MVAISFSEKRFIDMILGGTKRQTIRPYSASRVNTLLQNPHLTLWHRQRTPGRRKICEAELQEIFFLRWEHPLELIEMEEEALYGAVRTRSVFTALPEYDGSPPQMRFYPMTPGEVRELAALDGFESVMDMVRWFQGSCIRTLVGEPRSGAERR